MKHLVKRVVKRLRMIVPPLILAAMLVAIGYLPIACSKQTQATLKADAVGCGKSISLSTYVQVIGDAATEGWETALAKDGAQIGLEIVDCIAHDAIAILTAKGSGSAGPSTSQLESPEPIVAHLRAYLASRKPK